VVTESAKQIEYYFFTLYQYDFYFGKNACSLFAYCLLCELFDLFGDDRNYAFFVRATSIVRIFYFQEEEKVKMKKIWAMALAVVMMIAAVPVTVGAETDGYYTYAVENGEATITDVDTSISGDVTIPYTLGGYLVRSINSFAFKECNNSMSVTIPDNITYIDDFAFADCNGLESVTIGDGITYIHDFAFSNCQELTVINFGKNIKGIGAYSFGNCYNLENVFIPINITSISDIAFINCSKITEVFYEGGHVAWKKVTKDTIDNYLTSADHIHFNVSDPQKHYTLNEIIKEATCTEAGTGNYICNCGYYKLDDIAPTHNTEIHNNIVPTCTTDGYTGDTVCVDCGEILEAGNTIPVKGHTLGEWTNVTEPTEATEGLRVKSCTDCGAEIERETIPALTPASTPGDATGDGKINLTDVSNILKYIAKWDVALK